MKILMVCLGNICRSPLAEGILKSKLLKHIPELQIDSAGMGSWHAGEPPDHRSIAVARKYNVDISSQRARTFRTDDFTKFDLIFAMDRSNYNEIIGLSSNPSDRGKVHLILEFAGDQNLDEVPDPYYGNARQFEEVYGILDQACDMVVSNILKTKAKGNSSII